VRNLLFLLVLTTGCAWRPHALNTDQTAALVNGSSAVGIENPPPSPPDPTFIASPAERNSLPPEVKRQPSVGDWPEQNAIDGPFFDPHQQNAINGQSFDSSKVSEPHLVRSIFSDVCSDHVHYYSGESLGKLAIGVGAAAAFANTGADVDLRSEYQERLRCVGTDDVSEMLHVPKFLGNGYVTIPIFAASALVGSSFDETPLGRGVGEWGGRSLRTILVGAPPMLAMQWVTGASRPGETSGGSHWKPFDDSNGVSGHAFMGAAPFISAAKMTDAPLWKAGLYFASALPALSRINDDRHYASQVVLGWWMAYLAAIAVDETQLAQRHLTVGPTILPDGVGVGIEYRR
jgi:hypothetical protein